MRLSVLSGVGLIMILVLGCSTPEQRARELLDQGKYRDVIKEYPTSNAAIEALNKLGEQLFAEQKFEEILADPEMNREWVYKAELSLARRWFDERKFQQIVDRFPASDLAGPAKDSLAEDLYRQKEHRKVLEAFSGSPAAKKVDVHHPETRREMQKEQTEAYERARRAAIERIEKAEEQRAACRRRPSDCLLLGMSSAQVKELMGWPDDINRSVFSNSGRQRVHEQWVYETGGYYSYDAVYVYLEDGVLTSWQE